MVFFPSFSSSFAFLASIPLIFLSLTQSTFSSEQLSLLRSGLALQQSRCASRGNIIGSNNVLTAVSAVSASNAWAVGDPTVQGGLIEHWNGRRWKIVAGPSNGSISDQLESIAAISAHNIWAVGLTHDQQLQVDQTLVEHWNGTTWKIISSPNPGSHDNMFTSVSAVSANDVWAVGSYDTQNGTSRAALIEHWNGTQWRVVPAAGAGQGSLSGVTAISAHDVWAVGDYVGGTLTEHWNGRRWSVVTSPNPPAPSTGVLSSVAGRSSNDLWAVGTAYDPSTNNHRTLIEHWNGTAWKMASDVGAPVDSSLSGVTVLSATNAWAVGRFGEVRVGMAQTLIEHWNGTNWRPVSSPNAGGGNNFLYGIARVPHTSAVWTVGAFAGAQRYQTLAEYQP